MKKTRSPAKHITIPRTHKSAQKRGYASAGIGFDDLSKKLKANFVQVEGGGQGAFCGLGPSTDPSYWLVCYKDANGECHWVHVPRGAPLESHG
jgi:hypothetical protein